MGTHREGPEMQCSLHCVITGLLYCASKNVTCLLSRVSLTIYQLKKFFLWYEKCSQMYFSNSPLEKIDIWKGSGSLLLSLVHRLAALVITWELVGSTDSWALPCAHWIRISLWARSPQWFRLGQRHFVWDSLISLVRSWPKYHHRFSFSQESTYVGLKVFYFPLGLQEISLHCPHAFFFFPYIKWWKWKSLSHVQLFVIPETT